MSKGRLIGAAIIVKNIPFNMDKNCSAFCEIGDDLIKQTLEQTSQNLSLTARILGIDRSTIYRRRRNRNW
jgi:transcriptional regulator of acetoin/glycerol metabolism